MLYLTEHAGGHAPPQMMKKWRRLPPKNPKCVPATPSFVHHKGKKFFEHSERVRGRFARLPGILSEISWSKTLSLGLR